MEEVDKRLVKSVIEFEIMKILWSSPTHIKDIRKKLLENVEIGVKSETITRILDSMEKNGYASKPKGLRRSYVLTMEGKALFEHTWQSLDFTNNLISNSEKLAKWISMHLALKKIWIGEQIIQESIRNYQAEEMLKRRLDTA
jgi:DNA-binding PadR family transcriptional regulator